MNERTSKLINLIKENPNLKVVPMVATDCVQDDCYGYWLSQFDHAEVDEYYCSDERVYLMSNDFDDLVEQYMDNYDEGYPTNEEEIERWAIEKVESLSWKKAIIVYIECA